MSPFAKVIHVCIFLRVINKRIKLRFALLTYTVVKLKSLSVWIHCLFDHTDSFLSHLKYKVLQAFSLSVACSFITSCCIWQTALVFFISSTSEGYSSGCCQFLQSPFTCYMLISLPFCPIKLIFHLHSLLVIPGGTWPKG